MKRKTQISEREWIREWVKAAWGDSYLETLRLCNKWRRGRGGRRGRGLDGNSRRGEEKWRGNERWRRRKRWKGRSIGREWEWWSWFEGGREEIVETKRGRSHWWGWWVKKKSRWEKRMGEWVREMEKKVGPWGRLGLEQIRVLPHMHFHFIDTLAGWT